MAANVFAILRSGSDVPAIDVAIESTMPSTPCPLPAINPTIAGYAPKSTAARVATIIVPKTGSKTLCFLASANVTSCNAVTRANIPPKARANGLRACDAFSAVAMMVLRTASIGPVIDGANASMDD
jgi:hypothetical protein